MPRDALRTSHVGITLNDRSSKMELRLGRAMDNVQSLIEAETGLTLTRVPRLLLTDLVETLTARYGDTPGATFEKACAGVATWIKPDGGLWFVDEWGEPGRCVLVAEAKRQGTNTDRALEGLPKQSKGNAIERLGKNMRGIDALFLGEEITPFVCFGEGCDFDPGSSILDRVSTLNGLFPLNRVYVEKIQVADDVLKPVSLFFRGEPPWTPGEMAEVLVEVCRRAIAYYRDRYDLP